MSNYREKVTVQTTVHAPIEKVWGIWTNANHITKWYNASEDWHAPYAENDLKVGANFKTTMSAKDGSMSFDFIGTYTKVELNSAIDYSIVDGRKVEIKFSVDGNTTTVVETFEAEDENPIEVQRGGWQAILDSFKKYTEAN